MKANEYSNNPLEKKLGIKPGDIIKLLNIPDHYFDLFEQFPQDVEHKVEPEIKKNFIHYFPIGVEELEKELPGLKKELLENGMIWVSWPKKTSRIETTVNGTIIRSLGRKIGLIDAKVCAVDSDWSGIKLVIPVKDRR